jgi:hypothetical protein
MPTGIAPVKQALVKALRANAALKAAVSNEFHEAVAPADVDYPYVIYQVHSAPRDRYWGGETLRVTFDVFVLSDDQVEAHNLDQLVLEALTEPVLDLGTSGQRQLFCRRTMDLSSVDLDSAGQKVYQMGGLHEVWTDQTTA